MKVLIMMIIIHPITMAPVTTIVTGIHILLHIFLQNRNSDFGGFCPASNNNHPYNRDWEEHYYFMTFGWGLWTGFVFCVSGGVGLIGAIRPSKAT